jgi:hypothetical protein
MSRSHRDQTSSPLPCLRLSSIALLLPAVAQIWATDGEALSPAPGRRVVSLTPASGEFNGPSVAINPSNPRQVVAAFGSRVTVSYSTDAGEHWALAEGTAPTGYRGTGDISVAYDHQGHAILCFIAFDGAGPWRYWGHNPKRNGIQIRRSLDGGKTWEPNTIPVIEHAETPGIPFEDKPYIVADNQPKSPYVGNLYVGWTEDRTADSLILFSAPPTEALPGQLRWGSAISPAGRAMTKARCKDSAASSRPMAHCTSFGAARTTSFTPSRTMAAGRSRATAGLPKLGRPISWCSMPITPPDIRRST